MEGLLERGEGLGMVRGMEGVGMKVGVWRIKEKTVLGGKEGLGIKRGVRREKGEGVRMECVMGGLSVNLGE